MFNFYFLRQRPLKLCEPVTLGAAAIAGGAALAGGVVQGVGGLASAKKQYKYNKLLMEQQNAYNVANWEMNNRYNTPSAQRERLKAAGLNPDLIYQNGAAGLTSLTPNGVSGQSVSAPDLSGFGSGIGNAGAMAVQAYQEQRRVDSEVSLNKSAENLNDAKAREADANAAGKNIDNKYSDQEHQIQIRKFQSETNLNDQQANVCVATVDKLKSEKQLIDSNKEIADLTRDYLRQTLSDRVAMVSEQLRISRKQADLIVKYGDALYEADVQLKRAQAYGTVVSANAAAENAETNRLQYEVDKRRADFENYVSLATGYATYKQGQYTESKTVGQNLYNRFYPAQSMADIYSKYMQGYREGKGHPHLSFGGSFKGIGFSVGAGE